MENKEQQLIEEIRSLFRELIEEEKGRINLTARRIVPPNGYEYAQKAKDLYDKTIELESINSKYSAWHLKFIMEKEVERVNLHKHEYNGNTPKAKSVAKLQQLMHKATLSIKRSLYDILEDIQL